MTQRVIKGTLLNRVDGWLVCDSESYQGLVAR